MRAKVSAVWRATLGGARRHWMVIGGAIALVLIVAYAVASLIDEPLRRYTEEKMNRALKGYTARITTLDFHPHGFSLDLVLEIELR
jgi:peptidoglycan/LPS O-acetylase OafA/YrhL